MVLEKFKRDPQINFKNVRGKNSEGVFQVKLPEISKSEFVKPPSSCDEIQKIINSNDPS